MKSWVCSVVAAVLALSVSGFRPSTAPAIEPAERPVAAGTEARVHGSTNDPALLRRELLMKLDARISIQMAQAHLDARLALDDVIPVPYLGVDAEPVEGGVRVTNVYPLTGAADAGLRPGDVIKLLGGDPTTSKATLAQAVRSRRVGERTTLAVKRGDEALTITVTLGPRPEEDEDEEEQFPDLPPRFVFSTEPVTLALDGGVNEVPGSIDSVVGGHGLLGRWVIGAEGGQRFLRQAEADRTGIRFPMAIMKRFFAADVVGRVRFRFAAGLIDRAAGVVLRFQDPGNYLVARANAAEADLRIFRVANGIRKTLPGGVVKCPTDDDRWHTLEFSARGTQLVATVDGAATTTAVDSYFLNGRAGLWTKSDSTTDFADVRFEPVTPVADSRPK